MKLSARNVLKGKVKSIKPGAVNSEVILQLPNGLEIVSVVTKASTENLGLKEGKDVCHTGHRLSIRPCLARRPFPLLTS
jgi:molybdopterin-binding protein